MSLSVEIILPFMEEEPGRVWEMLRFGQPETMADEVDCEFYEEFCKAKDVKHKVTTSARPGFSVRFSCGEILYGHVRNYSHSFIVVKNLAKDIEDADYWVKPFLSLDRFIQSWVYNEQYQYWQNASDPIQYDAAGKCYTGLPMKSNGLPYPLEKMVIDTSNNPGRRVLRSGFVECVGAVMWLGDEFMNRTMLSPARLYSCPWLETDRINDKVTRIQAAEQPFDSATGIEGSIQRDLRSLLFENVMSQENCGT